MRERKPKRVVLAKSAEGVARLALLRKGVVVELLQCDELEADELKKRGACDGWVRLEDTQPCELGWLYQAGAFVAPK